MLCPTICYWDGTACPKILEAQLPAKMFDKHFCVMSTGRYDKGSESETAAEGIRKVASTTILTGYYCWLRPTCWTLFSHASGNLRAHAVIFAEKYLRRWEWCSWLRGRAGRIVKGKLLSATSWPAPADTLMDVPPLGSRPRASPRQCALVSRFANIRHIQKLSKFHKWW